METLLGIAIGIGLSAACGFRVFVPLLVMNLASLSGLLHLSPGFAWIGSYYATVAFSTATIAEVLGYCIPWLDPSYLLVLGIARGEESRAVAMVPAMTAAGVATRSRTWMKHEIQEE